MKILISFVVLLVFTFSVSLQSLPNGSQLSRSSLNTASLSGSELGVAAADSASAFIGYKRLDREISDHYGNPEGFTHYIISVPLVFV